MGHKFEPLPRKGDFYKKVWGYELWIVNDEEYCGKLLVFEKDKKFSMHYHLIKKESWYVAKGEFLYSWIETEKAAVKTVQIQEGDVIDLERGQPHQLRALTEGATIFEVSTKHFEEDSYRLIPGSSQEEFVADVIAEQIPQSVISRDLTKFWSLNDKLVDFSEIDFSNISQIEAETQYGWEAAMYWSNIFSKELDNEFFQLNPGDVYVDLGANIGMNCAYAESKGASKIYAIEPDPDVFKALEKNSNNNWVLENTAVSNKKGFMEISMWPNWAVKRILKCTTLEDIIERNNIDKIDYLKIDIEGGEKDLIPSIQPETWSKINKIFIEFHEDVFGYSEEARTEFIKTIQQNGFSFHIIIGSTQSFMYFWKV
jgi:FkbM family methyltransferase